MTAYDEVSQMGLINDEVSFHGTDVCALGLGTIEVGEAVEFEQREDRSAARITGPFGTHVGGSRRMRPNTSEA